MAKVKYIGPSDAVVVSIGGGEREFVRNHAVEIPDDIAGRDPDPRLGEAMKELHDAIARHDHLGAIALRDEIAGKGDKPGLDYGDGLLAQDIFVSAEPKKASKEDAK